MTSETEKTRPSPHTDRLARVVGRLVKAEPQEIGLLLWASAYHFFLFSSYYILRPLRDEFGLQGGQDDLPWLFTATFASMLVLNPVFSWLVARLPRERFIPYVYHFFAGNLLLFLLLLKFAPSDWLIPVGRVYYVWCAVYVLFVVSVFWGLMADLFSSSQAKRLFGFIAVGGSLGAICGSFIASHFSEYKANLFPIPIVLLELAALCVGIICRQASSRRHDVGKNPADSRTRTTRTPAVENKGGEVIGGSAWSGMLIILRSPYLLFICLYLFLYTLTNTYLYLAKIKVGRETMDLAAERIAFFANIDLLTNVMTITVQLFITSRILARLGIGLTLTVLPFVTMVGFGVLAWIMGRPDLASYVPLTIMLFESLRRTSNYALARPAREALYTVLGREEKYKSKSFIDTAVYRGGDQAGVWSKTYFDKTLGISFVSLSIALVPIAGLWLILGLILGWRQRILSEKTASLATGTTPVVS